MENVVSKIVLDLYSIEIQPQISRPEPEFGDFATNIALQLAGRIGKSPRDIAMEIAEHLRSTGEYSKVEVAGPGFINISLSDSALLQKATSVPAKIYQDVSYVTEYSCPNAFKELHTGHLYQTILGDVIARLIENAGATDKEINAQKKVISSIKKSIERTLSKENKAFRKCLNGQQKAKYSMIKKLERQDYKKDLKQKDYYKS